MVEPRLPPELERRIFEMAAEEGENIPNILHIAHRVRVWIEPLFYENLKVDSSPRFRFFLAAHKHKSDAFLAQTVRQVIINIQFAGSIAEVGAALVRCTGVTRLTGLGSLMSSTLPALIKGMRLRRTAMFFKHIFPDGIDLTLACFQTLTHIDLFDSVYEDHDATRYVDALLGLPALSHLSLNDDVRWDTIERLLREAPALTVLVLLWCGRPEAGKAHAATAPDTLEPPQACSRYRFLTTAYYSWDECIIDAPNYWSQAEAFLAAKQTGSIDSRCFWMADRDPQDRADSETAEREEETDSSLSAPDAAAIRGLASN
ncbi:Zn(2)-C6 fungal-type domain-containing protein [Mycena kentingensis (nom. inval.)]|nr:Zn(2)-C6 fungal-type domain-containing protein [Mycena kentingensis (nom. inval.)]